MLVPLGKLASFAHDFVEGLPKKSGAQAHVVGLSGDLGAGKTTFVQHVASELGITGVTSPTFVIAQRYEIIHPVFGALIHIDAYRLKPEEFHTIGWREFMKDPKNLVLVEWPENLGDTFPKEAPLLTFVVEDETSRLISYAN